MPKVHKITIHELDELGVDQKNRLYWNNEPVIMKQEIVLSKLVNIAIVAGGGSTFVIAVVECIRFFST